MDNFRVYVLGYNMSSTRLRPLDLVTCRAYKRDNNYSDVFYSRVWPEGWSKVRSAVTQHSSPASQQHEGNLSSFLPQGLRRDSALRG